MGVGRCPALFSPPEAGITGIGVSSVPPAHRGTLTSSDVLTIHSTASFGAVNCQNIPAVMPQAFLRKARWWVSEANPDEVGHCVSTEVHHPNDIHRGTPPKRHPPRYTTQTISTEVHPIHQATRRSTLSIRPYPRPPALHVIPVSRASVYTRTAVSSAIRT